MSPLANMPIHEAELLAVPPKTKPQSKHRDTAHNIITFFAYIPDAGQSIEATWVCNELAVDGTPGSEHLERLKYYQPTCPRRSALMNHGIRPHGGPGNSSKNKWRFLLFISFAVDSVACKHWCDEAVWWW